tara:strand:+ start:289 stop:441 length:153 start_codon:yes stop_codon:yes gene_type:complete
MSDLKLPKDVPCKNCGKPVQISEKYLGKTITAICSKCAEQQFKITRKDDY